MSCTQKVERSHRGDQEHPLLGQQTGLAGLLFSARRACCNQRYLAFWYLLVSVQHRMSL